MSDIDTGIRTFVLRQGRMTDAQRRAFEGEGRRFLVEWSEGPLDPATIFPVARPVVAEIGFGMGQASWRIALARPDYNYLGFEVHRPGVGRLLVDLLDHGVENLRIVNHDAVEVFERGLPEGSLAGIHLFYPDPWPKKRHHKRRMVRPGLAELLASRLAPGGYFYFVTDIEDYGASALEVLRDVPLLRNRYEGFAEPQAWRPETKFEARAASAGRGRYELVFERLAPAPSSARTER